MTVKHDLIYSHNQENYSFRLGKTDKEGERMSAVYQVIRVYNNNVILAKNLNTLAEFVLVGKGIGFGKKNRDIFRDEDGIIEKSFVTYDEKLKREYLSLVEQLDEKILSLGNEIIQMAEKRLGKLNERVNIVLTDHIGFALERIKAGMEIQNPFVHEIKILYKEEYAVGLVAKEMIEGETGLCISEDEIGFIALHLSAARENIDVKESLKNTRLIQELIGLIESELETKIEKDLTYSRLIHHLRSMLERSEQGDSVLEPFLKPIHLQFRKANQIAKKVKTKVEQETGVKVPRGEVGYLVLHIERIRRMKKQA